VNSCSARRDKRVTYCLGAVVLTLNATGSLLGLCRRRTWLTSLVKGPVLESTHGRDSHIRGEEEAGTYA